ncbi:MAG: hypothetical protein K6G28_04060 [Acholeplasmatales bacterium]|nr:hypothetical protein [Acholeplasmatales bacterium]
MNKKVLLIVEGEKAEPKIFNKIQEEFNLVFDIYCFGTNIYSLYKIMEENDFNVNIKDILLEIHPEYTTLLSNNFVYTYLIFDLDPHHTKKDDTRTIEQIVCDNIKKVKKMADYFVNETDPTVGKLYINYPMIESYKCCDSFFTKKYKNEIVDINNLAKFKKYVGTKKLSNTRIDKYSKDDLIKLIIQNIFKLNYIYENKWIMPNYDSYLIESDTKNVLIQQSKIIDSMKKISVLNTSLFIIVDYYGNRNGFYDQLYNETYKITNLDNN